MQLIRHDFPERTYRPHVCLPTQETAPLGWIT